MGLWVLVVEVWEFVKFSCEISFVVWNLKATEGDAIQRGISAKRWPVRGFFLS